MNRQPSISLKPLVAALAAVLAAWVGLTIWTAASEGSTTEVERRIVLSLRSADDPARMIGARWMEEATRDLTALGGYAVLLLAIAGFSTIIRLRHGARSMRFFLLTTVSAYAFAMLLKFMFGRERPSIVPHLSHVASSSFPSAHSMMSAVVYLTIGLILARERRDIRVRRVLTAMPLFLTLLVGTSRVFMGVHYPSDVLAGWTAGLLWTCAAVRLDWHLSRKCP